MKQIYRLWIRLLVMTVSYLAFLSAGSGQAYAAGVKIHYFTESDGYSQNKVTCVVQDRIGMIWVATWDGLYSYDGYRFKLHKGLSSTIPHREGDKSVEVERKLMPISAVDSVKVLDDNTLYCKTKVKNYIFNPIENIFSEAKQKVTFRKFVPSITLNEYIHSLPEFQGHKPKILLRDRQNGIWVFSEKGLCRVLPEQAPQPMLRFNHEAEEIVCAMKPDRHGRLWIATKFGQVIRIENSKLTIGNYAGAAEYLTPAGTLSKSPSVFGHNVYGILEASDGTVWLGSRMEGLFCLKDGVLKQFTTKNSGLNSDMIYYLAEDAFRRIWIATVDGGLNVYDHGRFLNARSCGWKGLGKDERVMKVKRIFISETSVNNRECGILYAGTDYGLLTAQVTKNIKDMTFHLNTMDINRDNSLRDNRTRSILKLGKETVVGTYGGGISVFNENENKNENSVALSNDISFTNYTTENSQISGDIIQGISTDGKGKVWGATMSNLFTYDSHTKTYNTVPLHSEEGYIFSEVDPVIMPDGIVLFGTNTGVLVIDSKKIGKGTFVPQLYINVPDQIDLDASNNRLSLTVSALDYNRTKDIVYAYMIEGLDKSWIYTHEPQINYSSLPPGKWILHVKSTNGDGVWVNNERLIIINRHPSFNERPVAWMFYGALVLVVVFVFVYVFRYIRRLQGEMKNIHLTYQEKLEYTTTRLQEDFLTHDTANTTNSGSAEGHKSDLSLEDKPNAEFKKKVEEYIAEHLVDSNLNVDDIAHEMCMSRSIFYLKMKQVFDVTPSNYIFEQRMQKAQELLATHQYNVSEVAYKCGFSDPRYFSRCFRKATGQAPSSLL